MFRFLLLFVAVKCLILFVPVESFEWCGTAFNVGPHFLRIAVLEQTFTEKCPPGFRAPGAWLGSDTNLQCYYFTPANSISYDLFSKKCHCENGHPNIHKDNRIRFKRHFRGYRPQARPVYGFAPAPQPRPQRYAQQQPAVFQNVDKSQFQCARWKDRCDNFPRTIGQEICPSGWMRNGLNYECYKTFPPQTWHEAEKTCLANNAHISSVTLAQEKDFLGDIIRHTFPNTVHRIQSEPLIIEEFHSWIGLNLTDRSNPKWFDAHSTWLTATEHARFDNAAGNENCGYINYRRDCNQQDFIKITMMDSRCEEQKPFTCKLIKTPPTTTPAATTTPPTTTTTTTATTLLIQQPTTTTTIATTKLVRQTCMV